MEKTIEENFEDLQIKRKLASVQIIKKLSPVEADPQFEVATVLGWNVVVPKGEFKRGKFNNLF